MPAIQRKGRDAGIRSARFCLSETKIDKESAIALFPLVVAAAAINSLMLMGIANYVTDHDTDHTAAGPIDRAAATDLHIGM